MKSVLRQEWKARKNSIILISAALFACTAIGVPFGVAGTDSGRTPFFGFFTAMLIISILFTAGSVFFIPLLKGAGNIGTDLLSDRGYLLLSLPKKPEVLFAGKMIVGLAEFIIYAVLVFFCLSFSVPFIDYVLNARGEPYAEIMRKIYRAVFIEKRDITVSVFFAGLAFFIFAQTVGNLAIVLYRSFMRTKKAALWVFSFMFIAVFVTLKTADVLIGKIASSGPFAGIMTQTWVGPLWFFTLVCMLFSLLYFFITVRLFERKVEL